MKNQEGCEHGCGHFDPSVPGCEKIKKTLQYRDLTTGQVIHIITASTCLVILVSPMTSKKCYGAAVGTQTAPVWNVCSLE